MEENYIICKCVHCERRILGSLSNIETGWIPRCYYCEEEMEIKRNNLKFEDSSTINHPFHYKSKDGNLEVLDIIEAFDLNFNLGNVIKYVIRKGKKGSDTENLSKAIFYLQREIEIITGVV